MKGQSETNNSTPIEYGRNELQNFRRYVHMQCYDNENDKKSRQPFTNWTTNTPEERMNNGNIYTHLNYTTDLFAKAPINMMDFCSSSAVNLYIRSQ